MSQKSPVLSLEELAALGARQQDLLDDLRYLAPEVSELWLKAGALVDRGSEMPGEPERIAEYVVQSWELDQLIHFASSSILELTAMSVCLTEHDIPGKRKVFQLAAEGVNRKVFNAVMSSEAADALSSDITTVRDYFPSAAINLSGAVAAVYAPLDGIRELLRAYLCEPQGASDKLQLLFEILKSAGIDHLSHFCPLIGPAIAIAETLKEQSERRVNELKTGLQERDRFLALNRAIRETLAGIKASESQLADARAEADRLDDGVKRAFRRGTGILAIIKEAQEA